MITPPTLQQLRDQILTDIQAGLGVSTPLLPKSRWGVLATALAGVLVLAYRFGAWCYRQIFVSTADRDELLRKGGDFGIYINPALAAQITATVTGTIGSTVPAGTLYRAGSGLLYKVAADVTLTGSTGSLILDCLTPGVGGNLSLPQTLQAASPVAGCLDAVQMVSTTVTGVDVEDLEAYRSRVLDRLSYPPQGGATPDYIKWAREVSGIVKAFVARPAGGFVVVYPLVSLTGTRIPSGGVLTQVSDYLNNASRLPMNANVSAAAATEKLFSITITGAVPSDTQTKAKVQAAIVAHLLTRYPLQYPDDPAPVNVVSTMNLGAIAIATGLRSGVLTMRKLGDGADSTTYTLAIGELANINGSITWV